MDPCKMKSLFKRLILLKLLCVLASILKDGEAAELNYSRFKREYVDENFDYLHRQKPTFRKANLRISETKCLEYIWERNQREAEANMAKYADANVLVFDEAGGRDALPGEFPHMGSLGWSTNEATWIFKCGSSLISPKFTLTAAHCSRVPLDGTIINQLPEIVRLGDTNIMDGSYSELYGIDAYILKITVHPEYSAPKKYYDIALVELESELQFSRSIQPVCLWSSFGFSSLGSKFTSTGWGVVDPVRGTTSTLLQAIEIDIIDSKLCNGLLSRSCNRHWCGLREHQLCAGDLAGGVDACEGDSGGPLQVKINLDSSEEGTMHYLIGITSFGIGCARPNLPGVYTRVSSFIDWIECIVWRETY